MTDVDRPARRGELVDWLLTVWVWLLVMALSVLIVALLPVYLGPVPFPASALLAGLMMFVTPRVCWGLTGSKLAALVPGVLWFVVTAGLVVYRDPLYRLPSTVGDWRLVALMLIGGSCSAASISLVWSRAAAPDSSAPRSSTLRSAGDTDQAGSSHPAP